MRWLWPCDYSRSSNRIQKKLKLTYSQFKRKTVFRLRKSGISSFSVFWTEQKMHNTKSRPAGIIIIIMNEGKKPIRHMSFLLSSFFLLFLRKINNYRYSISLLLIYYCIFVKIRVTLCFSFWHYFFFLLVGFISTSLIQKEKKKLFFFCVCLLSSMKLSAENEKKNWSVRKTSSVVWLSMQNNHYNNI